MRRFAPLGFVLAIAGAAAPGQQTPTFTSGVEVVRVDVLVTSGGIPVAGLTRNDFELLDNAVPQRIDVLASDQTPLNVVLAFDTSGSLTAERRDHLRGAATGLLDGLRASDKAGLVTFSHVVVQRSTLTSDVGQVRAALDGLSGGGDTALADGCYAALMLGQSEPGRALVIVFSDGVDTASWLPAERVLDAASRADVVAYAVSVNPAATPAFLKDLTRATGGRLYENRSTADLRDTFLQVLDEFRHRYVLTYTPKSVERAGWHRLTVRVKGRRVDIQARPGYMGS
jgi:Ca-activated chloride channel homolog